MIRPRPGFLAAVAAGLVLLPSASAKTVSQATSLINGKEVCYFPTGYIPDSQDVHIYAVSPNEDSLFDPYAGNVATFYGPDLFSNPENVLHNNTLVPKFIFSQGRYLPVLAVAPSAFKDADSHKAFLQDCIASIGASAFESAGNIEELTLPASLEFIGTRAFLDMENLKTLRFRSPLPPDVEIEITCQFTEIAGMATGTKLNHQLNYMTPLGRCNELESFMPSRKVYIPRGSWNLYRSNPFFALLYMDVEEYDAEMESPRNPDAPEGLSLGKTGYFRLEATGYTGSATSFSFPSTVSSDDYDLAVSMRENPYTLIGIGYRAFAGNETLKEINIDGAIEYIKDEAFKGCYAENVVIGGTVRYVGDEVFADMPRLKSVTILPSPDNARIYYDARAFNNVPKDAVLYYDPSDARIDITDYPFNSFKHFATVDLGVEDIAEAEAAACRAYAGEGEIRIVADTPTQCAVISIDGRNVFSEVVEGDSAIALPAGLYIVAVPGHSYKLIVK